MDNLKQGLPHLIMAALVIAAATALAINGTITGGEALIVITGAGGFSLGAGAASASAPAAPATVSVSSRSTGELTATAAPAGHTPPAPITPTA